MWILCVKYKSTMLQLVHVYVAGLRKFLNGSVQILLKTLDTKIDSITCNTMIDFIKVPKISSPCHENEMLSPVISTVKSYYILFIEIYC